METEITRLFGLRYPIFQGGMAWVSEATLAAAVSNAGGLGIISAMNMNGAYLREQIQKCRELTHKPFGVNIMLMSPFVEETAQVVLEEKVPVVTTGAGLPGVYMKKWVPAGIKVVPVIPSVAIAKRVERDGAAAVIAEGCESGGHIGELDHHDAGTPGGGCGSHSRSGRGRHCGRPWYRRIIHAGRPGRAVRHQVSGIR